MASFILKSPDVLKNCMIAISNSMGLVVTISKPTRSNTQNAYYWNILEIISKDQGDDKESLHDQLKWSVFGPVYKEYKNETIATVRSSRDLSKEDFGKLIEAAMTLAAYLNIKIPAKSYYEG